jgi:osmoprotectant transport system substrate-binding protein
VNLAVRRIAAIAVAVAFTLGAEACTNSGSNTPRPAGSGRGTIIVGVSGAFTENQLVAEMYAQVLERAGYTVERQFDLRSREVSQAALESGQIDVKPEYLSSLLLYVDRSGEHSNDPAAVAGELGAVLAPSGVAVLTPSPAQDQNEFVANAQTAQEYGLTTMSSLATVADKLILGAPPECPQRPFCLEGLRDTYGILFWDFVPLDAGGPQTVEALKKDDVQIALMFSTDPTIEANGFVPLEDDKQLQDAENITPVIRTAVLNNQVKNLLDSVSAALTSEKVTALIAKVVLDGQDIPTVATAFLRANHLL